MARSIPSWLKRREWLLAVMILCVYYFFHQQMPAAYTFEKLLDQTRVYMVDVGFMALGMLMVLILGDIDISVASTAALSSTVMAVCYQAGLPFPLSLLAMLAVGAACGLVNGLLVVRFKELFPMIITLSTGTLFRGIAYIILKDQSAGGFPGWFSKNLGYDSVPVLGVSIPTMLFFLLAALPVFYVWLHRTASGRRIFAAGTNIAASRYSGLPTDRIKVLVFVLNGLMAAAAGIFLCARTGSVKYTIATGFEMQAIAIAVLGGASTAGGRGSVPGIFLALVLMTCLKNGLMLIYNDAFILNLSIGALLIAIVLFPDIAVRLQRHRLLRRQRAAAAMVSSRE